MRRDGREDGEGEKGGRYCTQVCSYLFAGCIIIFGGRGTGTRLLPFGFWHILLAGIIINGCGIFLQNLQGRPVTIGSCTCLLQKHIRQKFLACIQHSTMSCNKYGLILSGCLKLVFEGSQSLNVLSLAVGGDKEKVQLVPTHGTFQWTMSGSRYRALYCQCDPPPTPIQSGHPPL